MGDDSIVKKIFLEIGKIRGKVDLLETKINRLESNTEMIRSAISEDGKQIAEISERCRIRGKQISQLVQRIGGCEEITGVFKFRDIEKKESKNTFRWGVTTLISILAILITLAIWLMSK